MADSKLKKKKPRIANSCDDIEIDRKIYSRDSIGKKLKTRLRSNRKNRIANNRV